MIWIYLVLLLGASSGWALYIVGGSQISAKFPLFLALVPIITVGLLSLLILWLGLVGIPFRPITVTPIYFAVCLVGWWLARKHSRSVFMLSQPTRVQILAFVGLLGIAAAILFNAVMLPFYRADTLGIYQPFAVELAAAHQLIPITPQRQLYELYPQLTSMTYSHIYSVAGWQHDYAANALNTLLSLSLLPAVFVLARVSYPEKPLTAWGAVFLIALTPDFSNWASSGYVDIPMGAAYTLAAAFAVRAIQRGAYIDTIMAGLLIGLAAWTKNAALLSIGLALIFMGFGLIKGQLSLNHLLLYCLTVVIVAAPWYLRNLALAGSLTPDTVWVGEARQTAAEIFIMLSRPQNYGLPGWILFAGVFWQLIRRDALHLLWWSLPYYAVWLLFASYDPRFVLLFLAFWAVIGGDLLATSWAQHRKSKTPIQWVLLGLVSLLTLQIMWHSVDYKRALLANPMMTHEEKQALVR